METLFWICMIIGIVLALNSVIFGDLLGDAMDGALELLSINGLPFLQSTVLVGGVTAFGGAGILLLRYSAFSPIVIILLAILIAMIIGALVFFLYVKPMKQSENSIAFTLDSLSGALAEVLVPIPAKGYGEVLVKVGAGFTNQIAASFEGIAISTDAKVVVVEVRDSTLYVSEISLPS